MKPLTRDEMKQIKGGIIEGCNQDCGAGKGAGSPCTTIAGGAFKNVALKNS